MGDSIGGSGISAVGFQVFGSKFGMATLLVPAATLAGSGSAGRDWAPAPPASAATTKTAGTATAVRFHNVRVDLCFMLLLPGALLRQLV